METQPSLTNAEKRTLKARAQKLEPVLRVGKNGLSESFLKSLDEELARHELIKIRFADFKDQKKELAPQLAEKTSSELIMRVGNVAVYYRKRPPQEL
ncbi:MAG: YhbY family RNA-binding protein [Verrucomicrobiota bacterium]